jgi:hypothetical protein
MSDRLSCSLSNLDYMRSLEGSSDPPDPEEPTQAPGSRTDQAQAPEQPKRELSEGAATIVARFSRAPDPFGNAGGASGTTDADGGYGQVVPNLPRSSEVWIDHGDDRTYSPDRSFTELSVSGGAVGVFGLRIEAGLRSSEDHLQFYVAGGVLLGPAMAAGVGAGVSMGTQATANSDPGILRCFTPAVEADLAVTPDGAPVAGSLSGGPGVGLGCASDLASFRFDSGKVPLYVP